MPSFLGLEGKRVLVTSGTKGAGAATAALFLAQPSAVGRYLLPLTSPLQKAARRWPMRYRRSLAALILSSICWAGRHRQLGATRCSATISGSRSWR